MQDRRCMKVIRAPSDSVWAKHHRIVGASRSTVEQVHVTTATAKETSHPGFQLADRHNYGLGRKNSANVASNKAGESEDAVSREFCGAAFWKHFGQGVIPRVANIRNLQTGQLTALRRSERVKSRQTSSDSAKMKTTCEDRPLPLATWLRSANRTASRGTTVNRVPNTILTLQVRKIIYQIYRKVSSRHSKKEVPCSFLTPKWTRNSFKDGLSFRDSLVLCHKRNHSGTDGACVRRPWWSSAAGSKPTRAKHRRKGKLG